MGNKKATKDRLLNGKGEQIVLCLTFSTVARVALICATIDFAASHVKLNMISTNRVHAFYFSLSYLLYLLVSTHISRIVCVYL